MITNIEKRKIYLLVDGNIRNLYSKVIKEILTKNIDYISDQTKTILVDTINATFIDSSLKKLIQNSTITFKEDCDHDPKSLDIHENVCSRFADRFKNQGKILVEKAVEYTTNELVQFRNNILHELGDIEKIPYEQLLKINLSIFEILLSDIAKQKDDYSDLLNICAYEELVKSILNKYEIIINKKISESLSETDYIQTCFDTIKERALEFYTIEICRYIEQESKSILNVKAISNEVLLEIQNEQFTEKIEPLTNKLNSLIDKLQGHNIDKNIILEEKHFEICHGEKFITYENLFGAYLHGAKSITVVEEHLQEYFQFDNLMQLCKLLVNIGDINRLHIITKNDKTKERFPIREELAELANSLRDHNIELTYKFSQIFHDREIICDNGWIIEIGRGLHIYNPPENNNLSKFDTYFRTCRQTKVHIYKDKERSSKYQMKPGVIQKQVKKIEKVERKIACGL